MNLSSGAPYILRLSLKRKAIPSYKAYPFSIPSIKALKTLKLHPKVTFLIGENGSGKSTLLEGLAVAAGFNAEGGSKNFAFSTRASHSVLSEFLELDKGNGFSKPRDGFFLRAESYFNVATEIEQLDKGGGNAPRLIDAYGKISLHEQSHGESFIALLGKRFRGQGLYLLDEPEAALSPSRQMTCLTLIHQLVQRHSQFIIATHSPILMAYPDSLIYEFSEKGIRKVDYEQTEHYAITREFLLRKEKMLKILLEEEQGTNEKKA